jgi:DNA replication protein DnaC
LLKLADRACAEDCSYEQFAAAPLKTEPDSRDNDGGQARIKTARFPARKTLEEFDFIFQTSLRRETGWRRTSALNSRATSWALTVSSGCGSCVWPQPSTELSTITSQR